MKASKLLMPGSEKSSDAKNSSIFGLSEQRNKNDQKEFFFVCTKKNLKNFFASTNEKKNFRERFRDGGFFFYPQKKFGSKSSQEFFFSFCSQKIFSLEKVSDQNVSIFLTRCTLNTIVSYAKSRIPHNPGTASCHSCHCKNSDLTCPLCGQLYELRQS